MIGRLVLVASLTLAGCGASASHPTAPPASVRATGILPVSAVPELPPVTHRLSALDVSKDSSIPGLARRLDKWGYLGGWQRTFQGESRRLTLVISRSLSFRDDTGASSFVHYMHAHIAGFFPFALVMPLSVSGGSGWLFEPPECACHMANPYLVGVALSGRRVTWLEINGPLATAKMLRSMFAMIPPPGHGSELTGASPPS
jgi:hypothetical protein